MGSRSHGGSLKLVAAPQVATKEVLQLSTSSVVWTVLKTVLDKSQHDLYKDRVLSKLLFASIHIVNLCCIEIGKENALCLVCVPRYFNKARNRI